MTTGASAAERALQWLEEIAAKTRGRVVTNEEIWNNNTDILASLCLSPLHIHHCFGGRILCSFRVPPHLANEEGNLQAGAIATLMDNVGCAAIMTDVGHHRISVEFNISYFCPAKIGEEVELDARVIGHKGKLTGVMMEVRIKGSRNMVASGRQWMASSAPLPLQKLKPWRGIGMQGAITTLMDILGCSAVMTDVVYFKRSVDYNISYISPDQANEVVELDVRVIQHKAELTRERW